MSRKLTSVFFERWGIGGNNKEFIPIEDFKLRFVEWPLLQLWVEDDDLQYLKIASGNIGLIYEFTKRFNFGGNLEVNE